MPMQPWLPLTTPNLPAFHGAAWTYVPDGVSWTSHFTDPRLYASGPKMPTVEEFMRMVGTLLSTTIVPFQVSKPFLPEEIFRVRSVRPFFATVMVFLSTSTVLVTASP